MDDVSEVADVSKNFANFLTVSRKFGYNCVYVFHVIVPSSQIWQKYNSQTNIFDIFPASVPFHIILFQKLFKVIVFCKAKNMLLHVRFGLIGSLAI